MSCHDFGSRPNQSSSCRDSPVLILSHAQTLISRLLPSFWLHNTTLCKLKAGEEPGNEATLTGNGLVAIERFLGCAELAVSIFQKANKTMITCFMILVFYTSIPACQYYLHDIVLFHWLGTADLAQSR